MKHTAVGGLLFLLAAACSLRVSAADSLACPSFKYSDGVLHLAVSARRKQKIVVGATPVDDTGRPIRSKTKSHVLEVTEGLNHLSVPVGDAGVHQLTFNLDGERRVIMANKGTWFTIPKSLFVTHTEPSPGTCGDTDRHAFMAGGFGVEVIRTPEPVSHVTLGRTFGYGSAAGVPVTPGMDALDLVAGGNVGAVTITLGQRISEDEMQYFDYHMVLDSSLRRYLIPVESFARRGNHRTPLKTLQSISIRSLHAAKVGSRILVQHVGLSPAGPRIADIKQNRRGITCSANSPPPHRSLLYYRTESGEITNRKVKSGRVSIGKRAKDVWLCSESGICDPADAPETTYATPPKGESPFLIDAFETAAQVNALRQPVSVFGSSEEVERRIRLERKDNHLLIGFRPTSSNDYIGYLTPLPETIPSEYKTVSVAIRCRAPLESVLLGVRDDQGREGRVPLSAYPDPSSRAGDRHLSPAGGAAQDARFETVSVPLRAIRGLVQSGYPGTPTFGRPVAVFITLMGDGEGSPREIEIDRVQLETKTVPMTIARFDRDRNVNVTDLGSIIYVENDNGGQIDVKLDAPGFNGKGMRITARSTRPEGYALAALGTSNVDVRDYRSLCFRVRAGEGGQRASIYLNDGKNRQYVLLEDFVHLGETWQEVEIPLFVFKKKGIDLSRVLQVIIAFENRTIEEEVLWFDDFVFR